MVAAISVRGGASMSAWLGNHGSRYIGNIILSDDSHSAGSVRPADDVVLPDHCRYEVGVEVVAQERVRQAAGQDVLLRRPVLTSQGEARCRACPDERNIDQVLNASPDSRVNERAV